MKKNSTVVIRRKQIFSEKKLTIGMDLGDRVTYYCILDEAGEVLVEQKVATTKQAIQQVFSRIPRSRVALETGVHSPWVSRLLTALGHEVIVAHARNVRLIGESSRKNKILCQKVLPSDSRQAAVARVYRGEPNSQEKSEATMPSPGKFYKRESQEKHFRGRRIFFYFPARVNEQGWF